MSVEIGIDLGSSKTVLFSDTKIVLEMPSVVTVDSETYEPVYFGNEAKQTIGRTSFALEYVFPIENGIIADYEIAEAMVKRFMDTAFGNKIVKPRVVATLPTGLTELQHHSLSNVLIAGGCRDIQIVEAPLATAVGLGFDFNKPDGNMIVDIGAGTTDISVISLGGIVESDSNKTASFEFDKNIIDYIKKQHNIAIGPLTAENIKMQIGAVIKRPIDITVIAKGRSLVNGLPQSFEVTSEEIYTAIKPTANKICSAIKKVIERTDPDLVSDIMQNGIYLTGGGSEIYGMDKLLAETLSTKINKVDDPSHSVVRGASEVLKKPQSVKHINYQLRSLKDLEIK